MAFARQLMMVFLMSCCVATATCGPALAQESKDPTTSDDKIELNKALKMAASLGQVEKVKDLLKQGADIQWRDKTDNGKTPLVKAVLGGRLEVVKVLLENGADIHYPDGSGRYPVYFCCISPNTEMLEFLLAKGGDKDINSGPFSMLVSVCDHGQGSPAMIPMIVKAGANPDEFKGNVSPLIAAIQLNPKYPGRAEMTRAYIKALIESKADVNLKDKREKLSPLQWAKKRGDQDIIEMLVNAGAKE